MPDWKQIVRERLAELKLAPEREAEILEELAQDLEQRHSDAMARGLSAAAAQRTALAELESCPRLARAIRDAEFAPVPQPLRDMEAARRASAREVVAGRRRGNMLANFAQDARFALRTFAKNPGFTLVAVLTLALGIGANTAVFSVVNGVLLRPLGYPQAERLVMFKQHQEPYGEAPQLAYQDYAEIQKQSPDFASLSAILIDQFVVLQQDVPYRVNGLRVTPNFFETLSVPPMLGRAFLPEEEIEGKDRVAIVSHRFWREQLNGDRAALGRSLTLDGESYILVGVLPASFDFRLPLTSSFGIADVDIYTPVGSSHELAQNRAVFTFEVLGRLRPDADGQRAQAGVDTIASRLAAAFPASNTGRRFRILPLQEQVTGNVRPALLILLAAAGLVLLIACVNLGSLLLARATARQRELSIRTALGASRARIVAQLITESLLLAVLGGATGVLLAMWVRATLVRLPLTEIPRLSEVSVDATVMFFAAGLTLLTAALCSLAPLAGLREASVESGLRDAGRATAGRVTARLRSALVASEVAIACVLLVGSVLLVTSLAGVLRVNTGFDTEQLLTLRVTLTQQRYQQWSQVTSTFRELAERVEALPQVSRVTLSGSLPLSGHNTGSSLWIEGRALAANEPAPAVHWQYVFPGYFRAMGIPLLRGRDFTPADQERAVHQTIISESLARMHFPGEDPIGKRVYYGTQREKPDWHEIIGVVGDVRHGALEESPAPRAYDVFGQHRGLGLFMIVRSSGDTAAVTASVRRVLRELDPQAPVYNVATMESLIDRNVAKRKYLAVLVASFGGLAFLLAAVGIHGVLAYNVERRTQEIGVRIALGAQRGHVIGLVVREGMWLVLAGLTIGLAASLALSRLLRGMLYGVQPADPSTYAVVAVVVAGAALLACYVPARRASRVDPLVALRYE